MMDKAEEHSRLLRNLRDAGCGRQLVEKFPASRENGNLREQLRLLNRQRAGLLNRLHAAQARIDCLDYLLYRIQQEHMTGQGR